MWQSLLHLWLVPPTDLVLACPEPAAGQPADPQGFYDYVTVNAAFNLAAVVSAIIVVLGVIICYQMFRGSLGERFVKRWWIGLVVTGIVCLAAVWVALATYHTTALANSCTTNPTAFAIKLPTSIVINRALVGLVWGMLVFAILSLLATLTLGKIPHRANGFFHNRGCPWPRFQP